MNLLCAKARVVPLKDLKVTSEKDTSTEPTDDLTLPRKELIGAKLLAELMNRVISIIPQHIDKVHYWCDSQVVLAWIHSEEQHKEVYVRNRVKIIQGLTNKRSWNYIPTDQNPADIISRGISVRKLLTTKRQLWLHGTTYVLAAPPNEYMPALKQTPIYVAVATHATDIDLENYVQKYKYSNSLPKTRRHFALVRRAMNNFMVRSETLKNKRIH